MFKDIRGERFGCLTAVAPLRSVKGRWFWRWRCDCGVEGERRADKLGLNLVCWHGRALSEDSAYRCWEQMRKRCYSVNSEHFPDYGGRGIVVCDRWRDDFEAFLSDMGPRPSRRHSIDRIDVNGNYDPGNCRWATASEQNRNKRTTVFVEGGDKLVELVERMGLKRENVYARLKMGWSLEDSLARPTRIYRKRS